MGTVFGQTSSQILLRGQVTDPNQAAVRTAKVRLLQGEKTVQETTTDATGQFRLAGVPAGQYVLEVTATGFMPYRLELHSRPADGLKIQLAVETIKSNVEVKGERKGISLAAAENANGIVLQGAALQRLPRNEEQLLRVLQRLSGSLTNQLDVRVNGVSGAKLPPLATIKEIRINNDPYSAAFHEPGNARIEIETKGGDEKMQAGGFFNYRNSALDARNAFSFDKQPLEHRDYGGWWSSKLFSPRAFIFGNFEQRRHDEATIVSAYTEDGLYADNVPLLSRQSFVNLRGDYTPSERHNLSFFYDHARDLSVGQGITSLDLPERGYDIRALEQSWQFVARSFLSPNFVNEVLGKYVRERIETSTDYYDEAVEVLGAYNGGGSQCCPALSQRQRFTFNDNLSFVRGAHFFKSGLSMAGLRMNDASENNFGGTWQFSSLTFQRLRRPILYTLNVGDPNLRYGLWQFAGYVQDEIKLKPNFTLTPGLRYEAQTQAGTYRNFAPRLSLAWSPTKAGNTVIRSGAGLYFQLLDDAQLTKALRFDGVRQRQVVIARPRFPNPFGNRPFESFPISVNRLASDLQLPQQWHLSTGIERSFPRDAVVTLTYTYVRGVHFFRARDVNAPSVDGVRPQPQFWRITQLESSATSTTHRLQLGYSQTLNPNITLFGNYTWGRMMDDTDGPESYPMDNYQLRNERGYAALDMRHQVFFGAMFMTPFGLEFAPMFYFNTGQPYNITTGLDENNDSIINDRPTGFARNAGRGPNYTSLDLSISRQLNFGPRAQDQDAPFGINFSVQFTNLLNHTNFANFNGIQTSPFFGRANAAQEARQVMLLVNFNFH